ncbi:uncharacterized protein [Linepithema humile]|uniref:uncharacterized protein n=1 Tax=Linepithema humile TaxID=83485 RepID=UPI00351E549F
MDRTIDSFMELESTKPLSEKSNTTNTISLLSDFPLSTMDELKAIEKKIKHDATFRSQLIEALHITAEGDSIQKRVNSMLRIVFNDNAASLFNWKGQRGVKQKLQGRRISKLMIETMIKTFPKMTESIFGRKAGPWLAQASFRLEKKNKRNNTSNEKENEKEPDISSGEETSVASSDASKTDN